MNNRVDLLTAIILTTPMIIGYIIGLYSQPRTRWSPQRHTKSHYRDRRHP